MQDKLVYEEPESVIVEMKLECGKVYRRHMKCTPSEQKAFLLSNEPLNGIIDWQAKWCEAQQQIAELREINSILKGYVRHLQILNEQQDRI